MKRTSAGNTRPRRAARPTAARLLFASNLRAARIAAALSQEDLAGAAGLHRTYVGSVERGERNVSIDNMERLALAVGRSLAELLTASGDEK